MVRKKTSKERITITSLLDKKNKAHILKDRNAALVMLVAYRAMTGVDEQPNRFMIQDIIDITGLTYIYALRLSTRLSIFGFKHVNKGKRSNVYALIEDKCPDWAIDLCNETLKIGQVKK